MRSVDGIEPVDASTPPAWEQCWGPYDLRFDERWVGAPDVVNSAEDLAESRRAHLNALFEQAKTQGQCVRSGGGHPIRCVRQDSPLGAAEYEVLIASTGRLPTRDNPHDWYNALAWLAMPETKQVLNRIQWQEVQSGMGAGANGRSKRRDVSTLMDENGAVWVSQDPTLSEDLCAFRWRRLFVERRQEVLTHTRLFMFGHALREKLDQPYPGICAHVRVLNVSPEVFSCLSEHRSRLDAVLAKDLDASLQSSADLTPLPVLGYPGWWPASESPAFYDNVAVFRPQRRFKNSG